MQASTQGEKQFLPPPLLLLVSVGGEFIGPPTPAALKALSYPLFELRWSLVEGYDFGESTTEHRLIKGSQL